MHRPSKKSCSRCPHELPVWGPAPKTQLQMSHAAINHTAEISPVPQDFGTSALGKHSPKRPLHFVAVPRRVVPIDRALQPFPESHLRLPAQQALGKRVV